MATSSSNKSSQASTNSQTTNNSDSSLNGGAGGVISNSTIQSLDAVIVDKALESNTAVAKNALEVTADVAGNAVDRSTSLARELTGSAFDFSGGLFKDVTAAYQKSQADNAAFQVGLVERFAQSSAATSSTLRDALATTLNSPALAKPADRGAPIDTTPASEKNTPLIWAVALGALVLWGRN